MRSRELDELFNGPEEPVPAKAKTTKLRYRAAAAGQGTASGFRVVQGDDDVQISERESLTETQPRLM